jgi:hypothetical protein
MVRRSPWKEDDGSANEFPISADKTSDKVQEIEAHEPMLSYPRKAQWYYSIVCSNDFKGEDESSTSRPRTTTLVMQVDKT